MAGDRAVRHADPVRSAQAAIALPDAWTILEVVPSSGAAVTVCIPDLWTLSGPEVEASNVTYVGAEDLGSI